MPTTHPVQELSDDHRLIERVLAALESELRNTRAGFPADFIERALAFFTEFADGHHHHKEEELLFPAIAARGIPSEGGPIGVMLYEHDMGRHMLASVRDNLPAARAGDAAAQQVVRDSAEHYINLLRQHIWKEDNILFRMARQVLTEADTAAMAAAFEAAGGSPAVARHVEFARSRPELVA